jgi:SPP1 family predicted phage head-tail adaptor
MNPGKFNARITFQRDLNKDQEVTNENGFPVENWTDVKTVWAMIKTVQGREYYQAAAVQAENTVRFVIRYTKGITNDMRIVYEGRVFEIIAPPINDDERNITLTIIAKEVIG